MAESNAKLVEKSERQLKIEEVFSKYQVSFDAEHDLYEKLVKKSRDITIESKRIIFLLHRKSVANDQNILNEAGKRLQEVYKSIIFGVGSCLINEDIYQYLPAYTSGMQEFVEALAFYHYLKEGKIISLQQICDGECLFKKNINSEESEGNKKRLQMSALLTPLDYLLGIADLTGELMRKCIASGNLDEPFQLRIILKDIYDAFLNTGNVEVRELSRKMQTLRASLNKVENACFMIKVRTAEAKNLLGSGEVLNKPLVSLADVFECDQDMPKNFDECDYDY